MSRFERRTTPSAAFCVVFNLGGNHKGGGHMKNSYPTNCKNCGNLFYVDMPCKADPNNKRKYVRACSKECTSALRSANIRNTHEKGMRKHTGITTKLDRDELIRLICYEHKYLGEVSRILGVKSTTLSRELKRLNVPNEFYRNCPQCSERFTCRMRCQVNPNSNKFKKFCSHKCFLRSRRKTDTWIEREINAYLTENRVGFIPQYSIGRMTADFYIPSINLVVEANGDFWHANPSIYTNENTMHPIQRRAIEKDKRKLRQLREQGYGVFILWENDLKHCKEKVLSELLTYIHGKEAK